jgi:hypothetical protein
VSENRARYAGKLGIEKTAMIRARAGIGYALTEAMDEGHCGLPLAQLVPMAVGLLDVPAEIIETALTLELHDGAVIADGERCVFLAGLHRADRAIGARIKALRSGALPWPAIDAAKAIRGSRPRPASRSPPASARRCNWLWRRRFSLSPAAPASAKRPSSTRS